MKCSANILNNKHSHKITCFDHAYQFYLFLDKYWYLLAIKDLGDNTIDKIRYSLSGVIISRVTDKLINGLIIKSQDSKTTVIKDKKVLYINQDIKLNPIRKPKTIKPLFVENANTGVIDLECYKSNQGIDKVYALGFKTNLKKKAVVDYIGANLDSEELFLNWLTSS